MIDESKYICLVQGGHDIQGGMFKYLESWVHERTKSGFKVVIVAIPEVCALLSESVHFTFNLPYSGEDSARHTYIKFLKGYYNSDLRAIHDELDEMKISSIHFTDETIYFPFLRNLFIGNKLITIHDPIYHPGQFNSIYTLLASYFCRLSYLVTPNLILHFHGSRGLGRNLIFKIKDKVFIKHPLPKTKYKKYNKNNIPILSFMGRIEEYKGLELFIKSLRLFQERDKRVVSILIVGSGDFDSNILNGLKFDINLVNKFVEADFFEKKISCIDVLVLPYLSGTQSGVGYLAKSYNKKIICTDVGNLPDLIDTDDDGYVVEPTEESISDAIVRVLNDIEK